MGILLAFVIVFSLYSQDSTSFETITVRVVADSPVDSINNDSNRVEFENSTSDTVEIDRMTIDEIKDSIESIDTTSLYLYASLNSTELIYSFDTT